MSFHRQNPDGSFSQFVIDKKSCTSNSDKTHAPPFFVVHREQMFFNAFFIVRFYIDIISTFSLSPSSVCSLVRSFVRSFVNPLCTHIHIQHTQTRAHQDENETKTITTTTPSRLNNQTCFFFCFLFFSLSSFFRVDFLFIFMFSD